MAIFRPKIAGSGPEMDTLSEGPVRACVGGQLTQNREDANPEVIKDAKFFDVALLELLFGEREQLDVTRNLRRVYYGDAGRDALEAQTTSDGACEGVVHRVRDVADLHSGRVAFRSGTHG